MHQPSTDSLWEFWVTKKNVDGQWQACWGGKMSNVSTSNGIWPFPYGTTATGLPFVGGQITAEELSRGEIRHVIGISLVEVEAAGLLSWLRRTARTGSIRWACRTGFRKACASGWTRRSRLIPCR
ncbi:hypothetical protein LP420_06990 [Massilia sp. B-10]|nr:hypothetical protein LP420_06990 [Massilia sp. B-10]